jgi:S-adenosylmethionine:tRNA ribosyltransferase-isomerase
MTIVDFTLPPSLEASQPPEWRGLTRDAVRLLVGRRATGEISHRAFADLPEILRPGDVLVVNTSATLPAAVPLVHTDLVAHFSTEQTDGRWLVELRRTHEKTTRPYGTAEVGQRYQLRGGGHIVLVEPYSTGRLWSTHVDVGQLGVVEYLCRYGDPIRYDYVTRPWPLSYYQTVFAREPGSAEMPSAGRPFTEQLVTRLVTAGVVVVPVLLHTGVASIEAHERPYPEWFSVTEPTARVINGLRSAGGRVIAVGTTVVRALESATDERGVVRVASGHTDLVVTPRRGVRIVDGLVTGFHEPRASHLDLLAAIAGQPLLEACYAEATAAGYLWHEFGDLNLLLP